MKQIGTKSQKQFIPAIIFIAATLAVVLGSMFYTNAWQGNTEKKEQIVVSKPVLESSALFWVAEERHLFSQNGLNITLQETDTGLASLDELLGGKADIAGASEFPVVVKAFKKEPIRIIASTDKADYMTLVARKDKGIEKVSDLRGKTVGTMQGTILEFYLGRFLELNGMNMQDITLVYVKTSAESVNAIINGGIDAVVVAEPYTSAVKDGLGANAVVFRVQSNQYMYAVIISTEKWIKSHPDLLTRLLKSLAQAEEYAIRNPAEAKSIVQKRLNVDSGYMDTVWRQNQFTLSLDQSLILAMEDEARWMIKNNLTTEKNMPNFLDYIYEDGIRAIKPEAVNIIR